MSGSGGLCQSALPLEPLTCLQAEVGVRASVCLRACACVRACACL